MGVVVGKKAEVEAYFASPALSQSTLKGLLKGVHSFNKKEEYEEKEYFVIGSAVDVILTGEEDQYEKEFFLSDVTKPAEAILDIIKRVYNGVCEMYDDVKADFNTPSSYSFKEYTKDKNFTLDNLREVLLHHANDAEYCMKMKPETRLERLISGNVKESTIGEDYFQSLILAYGKQVLSPENKDLIDRIVTSLRTNEATAKYFDRKALDTMGTVDMYYQLPIYFEQSGVQCKALLDLVVVMKDKEGKNTLVKPFDLKTMSGSTLQFVGSLRKFRYDIQAAWYTTALKSIFNSPIHNYGFLVESTTFPGTPLLYTLTNKVMDIGKVGRSAIRTAKGEQVYPEIKGYEDLLEDYIWYTNNGFETERIIAENNNELVLDWDGIL